MVNRPRITQGALALTSLLRLAQADSSCCDLLSSADPNSTIRNDGLTAAAYTDLNARWSNTAILAPACIFRPASAAALASGLTLLVNASCPFAVKGGGHNAAAGFNNIDGGVTINLGLLDGATLSADRSYVSLGAGGTWAHAYEKLVGDGIAFPGGFCGGTGVGGLAIGGGQGFFQPSAGWVVDSVLDYEVVLASGEVVHASASSHPDLYKALKGGGANFGIVTSVDVATFPYEDQMWAGQVVVPATAGLTATVLEELVEFTGKNNEADHAGVQAIFVYMPNGTALIDLAMASTDGVENPDVLKGLTALQPQVMNTMHRRSLSNFVAEADATQPPGYRVLSATITMANDLKAIQAVQAASDEVRKDLLKSVPDLEWMINYAPQPRVISSHSAKHGGNVMGLDTAKRDQIVAFLTPKWSEAEHDKVMQEGAVAWADKATAALEALGQAESFVYHNFAAPGQKPFCGYGAENAAFLKKVALEYDPEGVFQKLVPGGMKISVDC